MTPDGHAIGPAIQAEERFERAVGLVRELGAAMTPFGRPLLDALRLGRAVSLWDVVAPYMALYRFPLLVDWDVPRTLRSRWLEGSWRPYRGWMERVRMAAGLVASRNECACCQWPEGRAVLFLGFSSLFYRDVLRPVALALGRTSDLRSVAVGAPTERDWVPAAAQDDEVPLQSVWEHWDRHTRTCAADLESRLEPVQRDLLDGAWLNDVLAMRATGPEWQIDPSALRRELQWLCWLEFWKMIQQMAVAEHILDVHRPALIVSPDDADTRCRIYSLMARVSGVPSLVVQQGFTNRNGVEWRFFSADAVAVLGATSRDALIAHGVCPDRIRITGHPGFDTLITGLPEEVEAIRSALGAERGKRLILFACQPYVIGAFASRDARRAMIEAIRAAVDRVEGVFLVVKPHPDDDTHELRKLIRPSRRVRLVEKSNDISKLIKACDVLITFFSQAGLQSLIVGRPVINVAFPGSGTDSVYSASGATWIARSTDEIAQLLQTLTNGRREEEMQAREGARRQLLGRWTNGSDGRASERVVQLICNMLDERARGPSAADEPPSVTGGMR